MDEYISREEAVKTFCEKCRGYYDGHCIHRGECDVDVIQTVPTADVQPLKHGQWSNQMLFDDGFGGARVGYICSACKKYVPFRGNFCGECGARMDGDSDDQTE